MNAVDVRIGVNLMPNHWDDDVAPAGAPLLAKRRAMLDRIEAAGMDHVITGDHVMFHGGLGNDGLTDVASLVTANERLAVHLAVYLLVLRHPLAVARQLLTVAQLAPGRLTLGVGVGGDDRDEVQACGIDPRTRGRRMDEALTIVRRLVAGEQLDFAGEFFELNEAALVPIPEVPVPIIVGGRSEAAVRRAGRLGDGWLGIWVSAQRFAEAIERVAAYANDAGRRNQDWQHGMSIWCGFGSNRASARSHVAPIMERFYRLPFDTFERHVALGTPTEVAEYVAPYVEAGCGSINLIPYAGGVEAGIDAAAEVRQALRSQ
jgi:alkanesulfonate monooxygenase SsuD/methylene tetrahydromethanopterin reductase-like flavin-dependent oxidoreductase (luciferase family)